MAQAQQVKNSFTFVKGLISEASPLTFPENSSNDEKNFELLRSGARHKRLGIEHELPTTYSKVYDISKFKDNLITSYVWKSPSEDGSKAFLVIQIGNFLEFHDLSSESLNIGSEHIHGFQINLDDYRAPNTINSGTEKVSFASGKGFLFVNSSKIEPLYITYNPQGIIDVIPYTISIRDFEGVEDGYEVNERRVNIDNNHRYNIHNQGWGKKVWSIHGTAKKLEYIFFKEYTQGELKYPSNADISTGAMTGSPLRWDTSVPWQSYFGTTRAPRGKFIIDLFNKNSRHNNLVTDLNRELDSDTVAGHILNTGNKIPQEEILNRPPSSTFFSGRLFTCLGSNIYFSQLIKSKDNIDKFYAEADPTSYIDNELVATDGGVIPIPDAGNIISLVALASGVLVFSSNGIWFIDGSSDAFSANNFRTSYVSNVGITSKSSVVLVEDTAFYHNDSGIYRIQFDKVSGRPTPVNITETTIQEIYLDISAASRSLMTVSYDSTSKKIYWLYNSDPEYTGAEYKSRYDSILIYDVVLDAFYKYQISSLPGEESPYIYSIFYDQELRSLREEINVVDSLGTQVVDSNLSNIIVEDSALRAVKSSLYFLVGHKEGDGYYYSFAEFSGKSFFDWKSYDTLRKITGADTGAPYESFVTTGAILEDDIMRYKQAPKIQCVFNKTESRYVDNGLGGVFFDRPSSCLMSASWDWANAPVSGKVTNEQEVYRFKRPIIAGPIGSRLDDGLPVVTTRTKIRGRGKALSLTFTSPPGKDCQLAGWAIQLTGTTQP